MTDPVMASRPLLFRPDAFFMKPWRGWGVVRVGLKTQARFRVSGEGRSAARAAVLTQTLVFEDGQTRTIEWDVVSDDEDRYLAIERATGLEAQGRARGDDFEWSFLSEADTPMGKRRVRTTAIYTLAEEGRAFSFAQMRWLGIPLASVTTFYERA